MSVRERFGQSWVRRIASILMAASVFFFVGAVIWRNWQEIQNADLDLRQVCWHSQRCCSADTSSAGRCCGSI